MQDYWVEKNAIVSADRAHAVGLTVLYWNFCEEGIRSLLDHYSGMDRVDAAHFTFGMQPNSMLHTLTALVKRKEQEADVRDGLLFAIDCLDICRLNRNVVAHSWINLRGDRLFKQRKGSVPLTETYQFDLQQIRAVADECFAFGHYLMFVGLHIAARDHPHWVQPLPNRPAQPRRLASIDQYGPEVR